MSDAYRTTTNSCPTCSAHLHEFAKRLVCDACGGMFLEDADFEKACGELSGLIVPCDFRDVAPGDVPCPRCSVMMDDCKITLGKHKLRMAFKHCRQHGLWCGPDVLTGAFAVVGHGVSAGAGVHGGARDADRRGLDGLPLARHGPASSALSISRWGSRAKKRDPGPPPVDAYRDRALPCPACDPTLERMLAFAGARWSCGGCRGVFVERAAFEALVSEMSGAPYVLPEVAGPSGPRACPVCVEPMIAVALGTPTVDRCATHGIWFDDAELGAALIDLGTPQTRGVLAWAKRLFS